MHNSFDDIDFQKEFDQQESIATYYINFDKILQGLKLKYILIYSN